MSWQSFLDHIPIDPSKLDNQWVFIPVTQIVLMLKRWKTITYTLTMLIYIKKHTTQNEEFLNCLLNNNKDPT